MSASGLAHRCGIEISTLKEYRCCGFGDTGVQTSEHSGYAHRLACVAYHEVARVECVFHAVESDEFCALLGIPYNHFSASDLIDVEAVEWLAHCMEQIVGDVDVLLIGRNPTADRRSWSHLGDSFTVTPVMVTPL